MISEQLVADFKCFRDEAQDLRHLVNTFRKLFQADNETKQLLERSAGAFFSDLNQWLHDLFILRAARLLDKAATMGRPNLTAIKLVDDLTKAGASTQEIHRLLDALVAYREARLDDARNKVIAHFDLKQARNPSVLGAHSVEEYEGFLENLQLFCDAVGEAVGVGPLDFRHQPGPGDVDSLLCVLDRYEELMEEGGW